MRNSSFIARILAPVVTAVYLAGVFGFDIHISSETHSTFIAPLIAGISCDHFHPQAPCHSDDEEGDCGPHEDCCHDIVEMCDNPCLTCSAEDPVQVFLLPSICPAAYAPSTFTVAGPVRDCRGSSAPAGDLSLMCILRV